MFFLKIFLLSMLIAALGWVSATENVITCFGRVQRLSCDTGFISVQSAIYGRTDSTVCSAGRPHLETQNTQCSSSVPLISQRCNGQSACEFKTDDLGSSDPCVGTFKYYNTTYNCIQARLSMTCEGGYSTLDCGNNVIQITSANYGRTDRTICSEGLPSRLTEDTFCFAPDTLTSVVSRCNYKRSCVLEATNAIFTDPCVGTYKYLAVSYFCRPAVTSVTCEGKSATLTCESGILQILSANYGRTDSTTCSAGRPVGQIKKTDCYATNTQTEMTKRCEGKTSCVVPATNSVFSDPCVGTYKYLTAVYSCVLNEGFAFNRLASDSAVKNNREKYHF
ncbi:rhamnose-binding lectin-like [Hoplias malabaricus]|uniref:rhamnose-binding lectin-like n=1 Tax=Hoplias malabaricus TaxID=27720 RepID=UPI0034617FCA